MSPPGIWVGGPGHHPGTPASYNPSSQLPRQPSAAYSDAAVAGSSRDTVRGLDVVGTSLTLDGPPAAMRLARRTAGRARCTDGVRRGTVVVYGSAADRVVAALRASGYEVVIERAR